MTENNGEGAIPSDEKNPLQKAKRDLAAIQAEIEKIKSGIKEWIREIKSPDSAAGGADRGSLKRELHRMEVTLLELQRREAERMCQIASMEGREAAMKYRELLLKQAEDTVMEYSGRILVKGPGRAQ